ncbi:MAG: dTDP-4-dehydrorhamnose reductase [Xanthobacteraceae bacterium]
MRVLLIGANGQVGWELRRTMTSIGDVVAMDRSACDLSRPHDLSEIIRDAKPDIIVNAAAYTSVDKAEKEEEIATLVNGTAVGVIAAQARQLAALLIHYSTDYVFDGTKDCLYTEDDPPNPINAYGRSKLAGERAIAQCAGDYLIFRTTWVFAARGHNFLRTILRLARERDELSIVADQIGAPTWARHIADATALIVQRACRERANEQFASGILNVTAGGATSWWGFAEAILEHAMEQGLLRNRPKVRPIATSDYPLPAARPKNSRFAQERLRKRFGIELPEWQQGLLLCMRTL